jgi:hypothetical protein
MINQACDHLATNPVLADLFEPGDLRGSAPAQLLPFEVRAEEVYAWRMPHSSRLSRAVRAGTVRWIGSGPLSDPLELFRVIASHAMMARSLLSPLRTPAYWVRRETSDGSERFFRPALPEVQLSELLEVPTRQIGPALRPLQRDGAVEIVRSPSGVRAILMTDGFVEEDRFRTRLRA